MKSTTNRQPEIGIIGAGVSGICAAIQLQKQLGLNSFTLFESNSDVGGTWLSNTYKGCACDVESHLYSFSFEPNPYWSSLYPPQEEILEYFKNVAKKYNVYAHTKFNTRVIEVTWDENLWKWIVLTEDITNRDAKEKKTTVDILINGYGALRVPNIPEEFTPFQGAFVHSAEWDHTLLLKNKKVAIVGSGASAIQIIPNIVEEVKELHVYQRKPPYILPRPQYDISETVKKIFANIPLLLWFFRCFIFLYRELFYLFFKRKSLLRKIAFKVSQYEMKNQMPNNPDMLKALTPQYSYGCKRVLMSNDYYSTMILPKVKLHTAHIDRIFGKTIYTKDGQSEEVEVLILATGYRVQDYFAPLKMYGLNGKDIHHSWKTNGPQMYYGIVESSAPNMFHLLGPNTGLGHNSVIFQIECQTNFSMKLIKEMIKRNAQYLRVKPAAEKEFMDKLKDDMKSTVWGSTQCGSWYADARGEITTLWPHNCIQYWRETRNIDFSKFEFKTA